MPLVPSAAPLLAFAGAYMLLAVLPGPNFLVVAEASLSPRRRTGILAAAGIATGAGALALLSLSLAARVGSDPLLAAAGSLGFAALLLAIGGRALRRASRGAAGRVPAAGGPAAAAGSGVFLLGFATAAANPLSAAFFGSYLVAHRSGGAGLDAAAGAGAVFLVAGLWFGAVALMLSAPPSRRFLDRHRSRFDAAIGLALVAAGASMLLRLAPAI